MPSHDNRDFLTTLEAHEKTGLSLRYIQQLLQAKQLDGFKVGPVWFVYVDSLNVFVAQPRKRGPKGPHKKVKNDQSNASSDTKARSTIHDQRQEAEEPQRP